VRFLLKLVGGLILLLIGLAIFVKPKPEPWHGGVFTATKRVISRNLRDEASAQWRNLSKVQFAGEDEVAVCGQVNARNTLGGYTGFVPFFSVWHRERDTGRHNVSRMWVQSEAARFETDFRRYCRGTVLEMTPS
jgi:hypothetical protein